MVENITLERPEHIHEKVDSAQALLAELIAYGNTTGEFAVENVQDMAAYVHASIGVFEAPIFAHLYPLEYFEQAARGVTELLSKGLAIR